MTEKTHRSRVTILSLLAPALAASLLLSPAPARALDRASYSMEILVDGRPLDELPFRGKDYVEALEGREYSIRLTNRTGERIAVALSVDGLNSIDAKTTSARDARKWILDPWGTITIDGWQTGSATARRFYFTTEADSYGAWLGKTRNLGLVSAAFFREKRRPPTPIVRPSREDRRSEAAEEGARAPESERLAESARKSRASDDLAATGIGREIDHRVIRVRFDAEKAPAAVCELRYEYHEALVRLGVLPKPEAYWDEPLVRRERARGFEEEFAPDPYRK